MQVVVESSVPRTLASLPVGSTGILIGQVTAQNNFVCFIVPTPCLSEEEEEQVEPDGLENGTKKNTSGREKLCSNLENLQDWWIVEHSKQVSHSLPGGLDVIGMYVITPSDSVKALYPRFKNLLDSVESESLSFLHFKESPSAEAVRPSHGSRYLLQHCPVTGKLTAKYVDTSDKRSAFSPAAVKVKDSLRWLELSCVVGTSISVPFGELSRSSRTKMNTQIKEALSPLYQRVTSSLLVHNQSIVDRSSSVPYSSSAKQKRLKVTLLQELSGNSSHDNCVTEAVKSPDSHVTCTAGMVTVQGSCVCSAFVHTKANWSEAERAVKTDILRGISARLGILLHELSEMGQEEKKAKEGGSVVEDKNGKGFVEVVRRLVFPRRVAIKTPFFPFPLSDYCFADEGREESARRVQELFSVQDSSMEMFEISFLESINKEEEEEWNSEKQEGLNSQDRRENSKERPSNTGSSAGIRLLGLAGAVLATAAASAIFWFSNQGQIA